MRSACEALDFKTQCLQQGGLEKLEGLRLAFQPWSAHNKIKRRIFGNVFDQVWGTHLDTTRTRWLDNNRNGKIETQISSSHGNRYVERCWGFPYSRMKWNYFILFPLLIFGILGLFRFYFSFRYLQFLVFMFTFKNAGTRVFKKCQQFQIPRLTNIIFL